MLTDAAASATETAIEDLSAELDELKIAVTKLIAALAKDPLPLPPDWEWATAKQLAAWLGLGDARAVYWLRSTGQAPRGHRVGKETRFRRRDVEQWLATRAEQ
jgi:predicted DNA-binding transcriptional regulator AlpA